MTLLFLGIVVFAPLPVALAGTGTSVFTAHLDAITGGETDVTYADGTVSAPADATVDPGKFHNAFTLDGQGQGVVVSDLNSNSTHDAALEPNQVSVLAWVKGTSPGEDQIVVSKNDPGCGDQGVYGLTTGDAGGLQFYVQITSPDSDAPYPGTDYVRTPAIPASSIWDGQWHMVVGVFDGGPQQHSSVHAGNLVSLWVDGQQVSAAPLPSYDDDGTLAYSNGIAGSQQLLIGRSEDDTVCGNGAYGRDFVGSIDEVRIYPSTLQRAQIEQLYANSDGTEPPLDPDAFNDLAPPALTGTPKVGDTLTCTNQNVGTDDDSYTWERAPRNTQFANDPAWTPITGAGGPATDSGSGPTSSTYTLTAEDAGSRVRCHLYTADNFDAPSSSTPADFDVPTTNTPPQVQGAPQTGQAVTCDPGTGWQNNPTFSYQWLRDGAPIPGATQSTYTLVGSRIQDIVVNPNGDGNHHISCEVFGTNELGSSPPQISATVFAYDGAPFESSRPQVVSTDLDPSSGDPLEVQLSCVGGTFYDDYAGTPGYDHTYEWLRNGAAITGATSTTYQPTTDDLGRNIGCEVLASNPAGGGAAPSTNDPLIALPAGQTDGTILRDGGTNGADPTNLLAISDAYQRVADQIVVSRLQAGVGTALGQCRTIPNIPAGIPRVTLEPDGSLRLAGLPLKGQALSINQRCQVLLHAYGSVSVQPVGGVHWQVDGCVIPPHPVGFGQSMCPSLSIEVPPIDPAHPPAADQADLQALAQVTPEKILWDLNGDGRTDAVCPGSAPVLRTILNDGHWQPRAVIIDQAGQVSGVYHFATSDFELNGGTGPGTLRPSQVRVCATSFDPPPDAQTAPCITSGDFGRVHFEGNLCPVDVRSLSDDAYKQLLAANPALEQFMLAASEDRLKQEGAVTSSVARNGPAPEVYVPWSTPVKATPALARRPRVTIPIPAGATAAFENVTAAMSSYQSSLGFHAADLSAVDQTIKAPDLAGYALDQVYVSQDALGINGVTEVPLDGNGIMMVPSDVSAALPSVHDMTIAAVSAASHLGTPDVDGLPLATGGPLLSSLPDLASGADAVLRETNLTDVKNQLESEGTQAAKDLASKLDLGPFNLSGDAKVHLNNDGTATIQATANFPGLGAGPYGAALAINTQITADQSGNLHLDSLHVHSDSAWLLGISLRNLDLTYDDNVGLNIAGQILFPFPINAAIGINKFQIGPDGRFRALDASFTDNPGIDIGPGLFLSEFDGHLDLPSDNIGGGATLTAGPSADGCPVAGLHAEFNAHFANPFTLDADGDVDLACIHLGNVHLHADSSGLVTLDGYVSFPPPDLKDIPIAVSGHLGAAIHLPDWQATLDASGTIVDLLNGEVHLVISNAGLAGCGSVTAEVPLVGKFVSLFTGKPEKVEITVAGGAAVNFIDGIPPLNPVAMVANLRVFAGCDIGRYYTVAGAPHARMASGGYTFTLPPREAGASAFVIEGAGAAPLVTLRSPSGQVYDFTHAIDEPVRYGNGVWGKVVQIGDRTIVLVGDPAPGAWTVRTAPRSAPVTQVQIAPILPKPQITGRVSGRGSQRTLIYSVAPLPGQVVRLFEDAHNGQRFIKSVKRGGSGRVPFTVSEAQGTRRTIVAEVTENGLPRDNETLAHFTAPNPKVGRAQAITIRRHGGKALISWKPAAFAKTYVVTVRYGDGRQIPFTPRRGALHVTASGVLPGEGLRVTIGAISSGGHLGPPAVATLPGSMDVGRPKPLPKAPTHVKHPKKKKSRPKRKRH